MQHASSIPLPRVSRGLQRGREAQLVPLFCGSLAALLRHTSAHHVGRPAGQSRPPAAANCTRTALSPTPAARNRWMKKKKGTLSSGNPSLCALRGGFVRKHATRDTPTHQVPHQEGTTAPSTQREHQTHAGGEHPCPTHERKELPSSSGDTSKLRGHTGAELTFGQPPASVIWTGGRPATTARPRPALRGRRAPPGRRAPRGRRAPHRAVHDRPPRSADDRRRRTTRAERPPLRLPTMTTARRFWSCRRDPRARWRFPPISFARLRTTSCMIQ